MNKKRYWLRGGLLFSVTITALMFFVSLNIRYNYCECNGLLDLLSLVSSFNPLISVFAQFLPSDGISSLLSYLFLCFVYYFALGAVLGVLYSHLVISSFWNQNKKYVFRGTTISVVIGLILNLIFFLSEAASFAIFWVFTGGGSSTVGVKITSILFPIFSADNSLSRLDPADFVPSVIAYVVIGVIFGLFYGKIKNRNEIA